MRTFIATGLAVMGFAGSGSTQPLPVKPAPFARQLFTVEEITDRTPEARRAVLEQFARLRAQVPFAPPSREGTIIFPGVDGGAEWGGAAADPHGVLYVNSNEMPWILSMIDSSGATSLGQQVFLQNCVGCHGADRGGNAAANIPSLVEQTFTATIIPGRALVRCSAYATSSFPTPVSPVMRTVVSVSMRR